MFEKKRILVYDEPATVLLDVVRSEVHLSKGCAPVVSETPFRGAFYILTILLKLCRRTTSVACLTSGTQTVKRYHFIHSFICCVLECMPSAGKESNKSGALFLFTHREVNKPCAGDLYQVGGRSPPGSFPLTADGSYSAGQKNAGA